jgi:8-oxo-dGTP diphosphatase
MVRRLHAAALRLFGRLPRPVRRQVVRTISPKFTVGAICVIERGDGAILLVRQSYRRHWGFPGGLLQRKEAPEVGVRREVLEEVGLDVELIGEPAVVVHALHRRVDVIYRASIVGGAAGQANAVGPREQGDVFDTGSVEIIEARWFPPNELPDLQAEASGALVALARLGRPDAAA